MWQVAVHRHSAGGRGEGSALERVGAGGEQRVDDELVSEARGQVQRRVAVVVHLVHARTCAHDSHLNRCAMHTSITRPFTLQPSITQTQMRLRAILTLCSPASRRADIRNIYITYS